MNKEKLLKAQEELKAKVESIGRNPVGEQMEFAKIANLPYDGELPVPEVISEIAKTDTVEKGEDYYYFAISPDGKVVTTISNGSLTQTNVSPDSEQTATFAAYSSNEYYVYIPDLLGAKYDVISQKTELAMESLNRKEVRDVIAALFTAADTRDNNYAWDSGDTKIDFEKLVEMVRSLAKYGNKLVLISGGNVTTDLILMDYSEDKNRPISVELAGISKWIKLEELAYTHSTSQKVMDADYAILVATSDAKQNRPIHATRRKVTSIDGAGTKERIIWTQPTRIQVGSNPKWAYSVVAMEEYSINVANTYCVASFYNAATYVDYSA